ncbi:MAG TPA: transaldolase [Polyangiales bacterium]|nr:transaldolase [Polyangiales bacterium]
MARQLKIKIFADGADQQGMLEMYKNPRIAGFTTNPTLMRKAGISDYRAFAKAILATIPDRPISFEVFADEFDQMERQAREIQSWGRNVYVKIPVMNTQKKPAYELVKHLSSAGVQLNVTALLHLDQVRAVTSALAGGAPSVISVFAGRIADTGVDPMPLMSAALEVVRPHEQIELLWASPREVLNIYQADEVGCHIITATNDLIKKLSLAEKDLLEFSHETVKMFYDDARAAGYQL